MFSPFQTVLERAGFGTVLGRRAIGRSDVARHRDRITPAADTVARADFGGHPLLDRVGPGPYEDETGGTRSTRTNGRGERTSIIGFRILRESVLSSSARRIMVTNQCRTST